MNTAGEEPHQYDLFISHASEDKERFVRPLAQILQSLGVKLWYDEFTLHVGDSLSRSINNGLLSSRYGLVVVSHAFMEKDWPAQELAALTTRQVHERDVILPVWLGVSQQEVKAFNLMVADLVAVRAGDSDPLGIAFQVLKVVRPDLYAIRKRSDVETGPDVAALNDEIAEQLKQSISRRLPDNTWGEISPAIMRDVIIDVIDYVSQANSGLTAVTKARRADRGARPSGAHDYRAIVSKA